MATEELLLAIDGPHSTPNAVEDPAPYLQFAAGWFRLFARVAAEDQVPLQLRGLHIRKKCLAFASTPNSAPLARKVAARTIRIVAGADEPPKGADGLTDLVRQSAKALRGHQLAVWVGDWTAPLTLPADDQATELWERTELRVQPIRVGGADTTAKLATRSESAPFTVDVADADNARLLGAALYEDVDVELRLKRSADGIICGGEVLAVHPVDRTTKPVQSWRAWFKENAGEWDDVDNILVELGRST